MHLLIQILKKTSALCMGLVFLGGFFVASVNAWVLLSGYQNIARSAEQIPRGSIAVVLGTSPRSGKNLVANPFFEGRMNTAANLYHSGAISHFLLSGDNRRADYNEPSSMKEALRQRGVPATSMTLDYAGFRTLDSVGRAHRVFELNRPVIITDDFHIARALFLAKAEGLEALGYASESVPWRRSYKTRIREWASRIRAFLDVYFLKTQPHFLGNTIPLTTPTSPNPADPTE